MSDQLPIVVNPNQVLSLGKLLDRVSAKEAEKIELRQSRGPIAEGVVFVDMRRPKADGGGGETWAIDPNGSTHKWNV